MRGRDERGREGVKKLRAVESIEEGKKFISLQALHFVHISFSMGT